jgi:hypothetical protein
MEPIILSGLLGFIVPPIVAFLQRSSWPKWAKVGLAGVVSLAVAFLSLLQDGKLGDASWKVIVANLGVVFTVATAFYKLHFDDTQLNATLEAKKVL